MYVLQMYLYDFVATSLEFMEKVYKFTKMNHKIL